MSDGSRYDNEGNNTSSIGEEDSEKDSDSSESRMEPSTGLEIISNQQMEIPDHEDYTLYDLYEGASEMAYEPNRPSVNMFIPARSNGRDDNDNDAESNDDEEDNEYPFHYGNTIDDVLEYMNYAFNRTKNNIKAKRGKVTSAAKLFKEQQESITKAHQLKVKASLGPIIGYNINNMINANDVIDLDIGGNISLTTTREILTKYPNSLLAIYFNQKKELMKHNGRIFLDRNGQTFNHLLHYLKNNSLPVFPSKTEENDFFQECSYWQIPLKQACTPFQFDFRKCNNNLKLFQYNTVLEKTGKSHLHSHIILLDHQHGIVFLNQSLTALSSYVEFKVTINDPSPKKTQLIIGLIDITKYKHDSLLSSYWKESPCSFFWDIKSARLSKTNSNRIEIASKGNYGCRCASLEGTIAIEYNQGNHTISFYKNNTNLGIAFHDVPCNLVPSLYISFDYGTIGLSPNKSFEETIFL